MQALSLDQLVGQILGNYRIERFLGQGRLNAVYLARNLISQRLDALTMYLVPAHFSIEANARFLKRFHKESAAITKLDHPHILPVYEYGEYVGTPYLVTPYMTQGSLTDLLKRYSRYDHTEIVPILEQVASGVAYAHSKGYVHGALGPSNVVVRNQDALQVAGFGLMHMLQLSGIEKSDQPYAHLLTVGQTFLASPEYIAPEVVQGQLIDVRSDIYALGCILFELLCGRPPFSGSDAFEVARQHVTQDIPSLRTLHSGVPVALVSVVNQALERDPARRFQYVEELKEAFIQASRGASSKSVPRGRFAEEEQDWWEEAQVSERLQEMSPDRYGMSNTGKWQLLPPIITGKLPAVRIPSTGRVPSVGASPSATADQQWYGDSSAPVTLPPVPTVASIPDPGANGAYPTDVTGSKSLPYADYPVSASSESMRVAAKEERGANPSPGSGNNKMVLPVPDPAVNSMPGVYADTNKLAQSYSWWSQPGTGEGEEKAHPYKFEEYAQETQAAQIPPTREPLAMSGSANWMSEPVVPLNRRRDFGTARKKSSKMSRRSVVAFLATGGVLAAGTTAVALNLKYFERLLGLTNQAQTKANNAPPAARVNTQPTQPPKTQPVQPPPHTGAVIGNTKQMTNSALPFANPANNTPGLLVRLASGAFVAYDRACTHVGVLVNYDPATQKFICPAHGAIFDPARGGAVVQGPAQLPLPKIAVQVQADGTVTTV